MEKVITKTYFWNTLNDGVECKIPLPLMEDEHIRCSYRLLQEALIIRDIGGVEKSRIPFKDKTDKWIYTWIERFEKVIQERKLKPYKVDKEFIFLRLRERHIKSKFVLQRNNKFDEI